MVKPIRVSTFVAAVLLLTTLPLVLSGGEPLSVRRRVANQPEMGNVAWCDVRSGLGDYTFLPPSGWDIHARPDQCRLYLVPSNSFVRIEVRFMPPASSPAVAGSTEALREQLQQDYPGLVILDQFNLYTGAAPATAFDLEWKLSKDVRMARRVVFLPAAGGRIEFHLHARPEAIADSYHLFGALLTSFHGAPPRDDEPPKPESGARSTDG
jgi:hypothetical protein